MAEDIREVSLPRTELVREIAEIIGATVEETTMFGNEVVMFETREGTRGMPHDVKRVYAYK